MLAALLTAALAAPPEHAMQVGVASGVDLFHSKSPRVVLGLPYPAPALWLGWAYDPGAWGGVWLGAHTAPLAFFVQRQYGGGDVIIQTTNAPLVVVDLGVDHAVGATTLGAYASAGVTAYEAGLRTQWVPGRHGLELRAGWRYPKGVALSAGARFGIGPTR